MSCRTVYGFSAGGALFDLGNKLVSGFKHFNLTNKSNSTTDAGGPCGQGDVMLQKHNIEGFITRNNLQDSVICLHASYKSLGSVRGGPHTLIDAFLEQDCTILVPSFYYESETHPIDRNYKNNGIDYDSIDELCTCSYEDRPEQIDRSMGVIPKLLVSDPGSIRTRNPHDSFCVRGKHAKTIFRDENVLSVYSPYKSIVSEKLRAHIVLIGVDFSSCTPIHFAEEKAGRTLFRRWAVYHGKTVEVEVGSCSDGFEKLRSHTRELEKVDFLGNSEVRMYGFEEFIQTVSSVLGTSPSVVTCEDVSCLRCKDMAGGGRVTSQQAGGIREPEGA
ncbi:MAG: AAC(3) family N-acetyltransferase [Kiritimatiellae bacterium]|jgi:aminoglycoside 3-N-acetyltransferase|nr:AAC(3) family N-acetyltransferase [Kiritimatiellia bacterium]